jgi:hypothetical protein
MALGSHTGPGGAGGEGGAGVVFFLQLQKANKIKDKRVVKKTSLNRIFLMTMDQIIFKNN